MSPFSAVGVLSVFSKGHVTLQRKQFDEAFDALVLLLEKANDQKHKLIDNLEDSFDEKKGV